MVLFSPSYTSYAEAVKVAGGKPIFVNLTEADGWRIDFKSLERKINSRTAAILFCNPNNPTGTIFSKEDLLKIAALAEKKKFFIISDEVYKDFIYNSKVPGKIDTSLQGSASLWGSADKQQFFSLAQIPELRKRVIRIFSLSKAYAMTGWRIGFLHSDEEVVKEILKVHDSLVTCAPVISQYAAIAALDFGGEEVEKFRQQYQERRDLICRHFDDLKDFFLIKNRTVLILFFRNYCRKGILGNLLWICWKKQMSRLCRALLSARAARVISGCLSVGAKKILTKR